MLYLKIFNKLTKFFYPAKSVPADDGAIASTADGYSGGWGINEDTTLSINTVWACTKLISETISTMPLHIYKKTADGREKDSGHPLNYILKKKPNTNSTTALFWQSFVASMLLRGNGLARKLMIGERLVGLQFLPFSNLQIRLNSKKEVIISEILPNGGLKEIPKKEIFKVANFSLDGNWGKSVISAGAGDFGNALNTKQSANQMMEKGMLQTIAFKTDKRIKEEQRKEFKKRFDEYSGAVNAGRSILLEDGMEIQPISLNAKDAQLLENKAFGVEEICRWFGVDPSLIGHGQAVSNWGTGLEQKMIGFLTFTLRPILTKIEQSINTELIKNDNYFVEFSIEGLLRADSTARSAYYREMVNAGIMTRDEVRRLENLPKKGGNAGELMVNMATQPIDTLGEDYNAKL